MRKIIKLGRVQAHTSRGNAIGVPVYCKIEFADGRLAITGVEGPRSNGDCYGSCGQIVMGHAANHGASITPGEGWSAELIARFLDVWERWHLNDMRAGCEHQRGLDVSRKVEIVRYGLTTEALRMRSEAIEYSAREAAAGRVPRLTDTARALILLENCFGDCFAPPDADSALSGCYEVKRREDKAIGWATPTEHPDGMLGKACPTCGYKYGSAWLREDVPSDVIAFLESLPDSPDSPAWI